MQTQLDWVQLKQLERLALTKQLDSIIDAIQSRNKKIQQIYDSAKELHNAAVMQSASPEIIKAAEEHLKLCRTLFAEPKKPSECV